MKIILVLIILVIVSIPLHSFSASQGLIDTAIKNKQAPTGQKDHSLRAPLGLRLAIVPDGFRLTWKPSPQDPGKVTGYEILRSTNIANGPFNSVGRVGKGIFEFVDKTSSPENIYFYKVRAVAGDKFSSDSNTVTGER